MKSKDRSITKQIKDLHRHWVQPAHKGRVLDLGCGQGSSFSCWLADTCESYLGIDLSEVAVTQFRKQLKQKGIQNAAVRVMEFLENDFPKGYFDLIYASAVLHHFNDMDQLCREMHRVLKPTGIIVSLDPLSTNVVSWAVRMVYRCFQTNWEWEWPLTKHTFSILQHYFIIEAVQGFLGPLTLLGFILSRIPGFRLLGERAYGKGIQWDEMYARCIGPALWRRNIVALRMRKV